MNNFVVILFRAVGVVYKRPFCYPTVTQLVEALCYKPECRGSLEFFIDLILPAAFWPWGWIRNEYQEYHVTGIGSRCVGLTTLPSSCTNFHEILEHKPSGILRACTWIALLLPLPFYPINNIYTTPNLVWMTCQKCTQKFVGESCFMRDKPPPSWRTLHLLGCNWVVRRGSGRNWLKDSWCDSSGHRGVLSVRVLLPDSNCFPSPIRRLKSLKSERIA
jgi:hypothetical protein